MDKKKLIKDEIEKKGRLNVVKPLDGKYFEKTGDEDPDGHFVGINSTKPMKPVKPGKNMEKPDDFVGYIGPGNSNRSK